MISQLLRQTGMWRASSIDCTQSKATPTGFPVLDERLSGGGWPSDGIAEFLHDQPGIGELRLLMPAMSRLSHGWRRWILWVSPPHIPYAPALASAGIDMSKLLVVKPESRSDRLWVMEKALSSQSCSLVLAWPGDIREKEIRRLQVAGKDGGCLGVLFRGSAASRRSSPAELRIQVESATPPALSQGSRVRLKILKRRGGWPTDFINLDLDDRLNRVTPDYSEIPVSRIARKESREAPARHGRHHESANDAKL